MAPEVKHGRSIEDLAAMAKLLPPRYTLNISIDETGVSINYFDGWDYGDESCEDHATLDDEILACVNAARALEDMKPVQWPEGEATA